MLVQSAIGVTQGHLCLLQRPLVLSVMRDAMRVRAAWLGADSEVGRALGLQWDLVGRRVQSVMLHAMRLRLGLFVRPMGCQRSTAISCRLVRHVLEAANAARQTEAVVSAVEITCVKSGLLALGTALRVLIGLVGTGVRSRRV